MVEEMYAEYVRQEHILRRRIKEIGFHGEAARLDMLSKCLANIVYAKVTMRHWVEEGDKHGCTKQE